MSSSATSWIRLAHALQSCVVAGGALALIDASSATARGDFGLLALVYALAVVLGAAFVLAVGITAISVVVDRAGPVVDRARGWLAATAAAVISLPTLGAWIRIESSGAVVSTVLLVTIAGGAGVSWWLGRRADNSLRWLTACLIAVPLVDISTASVELTARVRGDAVELPLLLVVAAMPATIATAELCRRLLRALDGGAPDRKQAALWTVGGLAIALGAANFALGLYLEARLVAFAIAFTALTLGATAIRPRIGPRLFAIPLAVALALVVQLRASTSPVDPTSWQLATKTTLTGELVRRAGVLQSSFASFGDELLALPEATAGRELAAAARRWNADRAEPGRFGPDLSVVLITVDTFRYDHVGYSGSGRPELTPRLDGLARRAHRFHRAYAQGGWTSLSIPALLWSRHPSDLRFSRVFEDPYFGLHLEEEVEPDQRFPKAFQAPRAEPSQNLAEVLDGSGIQTLSVTNDGFTHYFEPRLGFVRGFGENVYPREHFDGQAPPGVAPEVPDALAVDLALDLLDEQGEGRFVLWLHLFGPHRSYVRWPETPAGWSDYESELHAVDEQIGRVLDHLEARGLTDHTAVIVVGDHGEALGEHGSTGHGLQAYEESIRVPLLVALPGGGDSDVNDAVGLIDLGPTMLEILGQPIPDHFEGFSLGPFLAGEPDLDRPPVLTETWRVGVRDDTKDPHLLAVIEGPHKVIIDWRAATMAFYDLQADPAEQHNIVGSATSQQRDKLVRLAAFALGTRD